MKSLKEEIDLLAKMYAMAIETYDKETDFNKKNEYARILHECYILLKEKERAINHTNSSNNKTNQNSNVTYHYVSIYNPFANHVYFKNITREYGESYDSLLNVKTVKENKLVHGFWNDRYETVYHRISFPIIVGKVGNRVFDVITKEEYLLQADNFNTTQVRYKGNYYSVNENYMTDNLVVHPVYNVSKLVVSDMLRSLTDEDVVVYKDKIRKLKEEVINLNRDYFNEKINYAHTHLSDDEYIRRFGKK